MSGLAAELSSCLRNWVFAIRILLVGSFSICCFIYWNRSSPTFQIADRSPIRFVILLFVSLWLSTSHKSRNTYSLDLHKEVELAVFSDRCFLGGVLFLISSSGFPFCLTPHVHSSLWRRGGCTISKRKDARSVAVLVCDKEAQGDQQWGLSMSITSEIIQSRVCGISQSRHVNVLMKNR